LAETEARKIGEQCVNWAGGPPFKFRDPADTTSTGGAPSFAFFAKGGKHGSQALHRPTSDASADL